MKTQTLFAIGFGTLLVALTGCKTPARFTDLGPAGGHAWSGTGSTSKSLDLSTAPIESRGLADGTTGVALHDSSLPDDSGLADREMDRTAFASETVYFDYDRANVNASEGTKVELVIAALKSRGTGYDLLVEGHTDERGTEEYNRALGERRALSIRELLVKSGLEGTRVFTRTFGKDQPAVAAHDEAAWSKNRRGEFVLVLPKKLITTQNTK